MKWLMILVFILIGTTNVALAADPDRAFLGQHLAVPYPGKMSAGIEPQITGATLGGCVSSLRPGVWEADDDGGWIYRININDKLIGQSTEIGLLFSPQPRGCIAG